jgi:hypothetical protein
MTQVERNAPNSTAIERLRSRAEDLSKKPIRIHVDHAELEAAERDLKRLGEALAEFNRKAF